MPTTGAFARTLCLAVLATGFLLAVRAPAAPWGDGPGASHAAPMALDDVQPGLWAVTVAGEPTRSMCVVDPAALTQIRHREAACSRMVIADQGTRATVHYSCPASGWGRTSLQVETPRSVRIETQGIADGAPFAFTAQARRTGDCGGMQHAAIVR